MRRAAQVVGILAVLMSGSFSGACAQTLTPEQKQTVAALKEDLGRVRQEIDQATKEDAKYSGGLIKALIAVRLEVLKTNAALIEQRVHALEGGARQNVVVNVTKADPARAAELAKDMEAQKAKVAEARREADRYSGGLVQALSETTFVTATNTLAMLEQQYFVAKYGLATPTPTGDSPQASKPAPPASAGSANPGSGTSDSKPSNCLKIDTFDSSVLSANDTFTELAWKVDVINSCGEPFSVRVTFTISDKDEFELDSDHEDISVPANGIGKARGKMLVNPPEKARRMAKQGASISIR